MSTTALRRRKVEWALTCALRRKSASVDCCSPPLKRRTNQCSNSKAWWTSSSNNFLKCICFSLLVWSAKNKLEFRLSKSRSSLRKASRCNRTFLITNATLPRCVTHDLYLRTPFRILKSEKSPPSFCSRLHRTGSRCSKTLYSRKSVTRCPSKLERWCRNFQRAGWAFNSGA